MSIENQILELVKKAGPKNPIEYVDSIVRPMAREKLDNLLRTCKDCPIGQDSKIRSLSYGDDQAAIMIINDGIYLEQVNGDDIVYPLQGTPEMALIDALIDAYHINRRQLFWMNAVNCCTCDCKGRERAPNIHEAEYCRGYIERAIEIIKPVMIILLGNIPLKIFAPDKTIAENHGELIEVHGTLAMPLYSPHMLIQMREDENQLEDLLAQYETEFCDDFKKAFKYIQDNFRGNVVLEPLT